MNRAELEVRAQEWRRHHRRRRAAFAIASALLTAALLLRLSAVGAGAVGVIVGGIVWLRLRRQAPAIDAATVAAHLNRLSPALEESAALWLQEPPTLDVLQRLQLHRLDTAWAALPDRESLGRPLPRGLRMPFAAALAGLLALVGAAVWPTATPSAPSTHTRLPAADVADPAVPVTTLRSGSLRVEPPAYLGQPTRFVAALDGELPAGSRVTWEIAASVNVTSVALRVAQVSDELQAIVVGPGQFRLERVVNDTLLYQVVLGTDRGTREVRPQMHVLTAVPDAPPRLGWLQPLTPRTVLDPAGRQAVTVRLAAADDHGVADVRLVATVAKGSGEGVKFREQEIPLTLEPAAGTTGATAVYSRELDLPALGLEPGDEIYFHALASDRRTPEPNIARSETRFVVLLGPATELSDPGTAIAGINLVPQYFRSQRQLIIDTERLLAERAQLSEDEFRARSEDIGVDQKLLRLRYGQFLGEEFEPVGAGASEVHDDAATRSTTPVRTPDQAAAARDAAVERAVELSHGAHATEDAAQLEGRPKTLEEIAAPFVHRHDIAEAASLHDVEVKASLRAVLAAMWEAEGFLRTVRPAEALPAENRALELLKALQQADRLYVKRVGFEPSPIKIDERRLRGELEAIPPSAVSKVPVVEADSELAAVRDALSRLDIHGPGRLPPALAEAVGNRLGLAAKAKPARYLAALEIWTRQNPTPLPKGEREELRRALGSLLPIPSESPVRSAEIAPKLGSRYFEALTP